MFCTCLVMLQKCNTTEGKLFIWGVCLDFYMIFAKLWNQFLRCSQDCIFVRSCQIRVYKRRPCRGSLSGTLRNKKRAEREASENACFLGSNSEGPAKENGACLTSYYAESRENGESVQSRPAPPSGAANLMVYAFCRRPLTIAHCFKTCDSWHYSEQMLLFVVPERVIWHAWCLHFVVLGGS